MQEVELTWADKLMEKGREEGREAGVLEGMRRSLQRQLTAKFGDLPTAVAAKIESMSAAELDSVLDRVLTATALDELELGV